MVQNITARRTDDSKLTDWYYGIDKGLLVCIFGLMGIGMIANVSAGSAMFVRNGWNWYHFFISMLPFYILGTLGLLYVSMSDKKWVLVISWINVIICFLLVCLTAANLFVINGSARWIPVLGHTFMPSDLMKPGFIIITAWFLSKMKDIYGDIFKNREAWRFRLFSWWPYISAFLLFIVLLVKQPDIGTTMLYLWVLLVMLIVAGLPRLWVVLMGSLGAIGAIGAFFFVPHVHDRIIAFFGTLDPQSQIGISVNSIRQGGLFGMGEKAFVSERLPMAESDFVYSILAEDFGAIACCFGIFFLLIIIRHMLKNAIGARDKFVFYAVSGTIALFGGQICMNLATVLNLMPAKGMTLPFISFGGSSFLGFCLLFGMILAIVREDKWK